jgi:hypothetical protein
METAEIVERPSKAKVLNYSEDDPQNIIPMTEHIVGMTAGHTDN